MTNTKINHISLEEVDSTNNYLKSLKSSQTLEEFTYVTALFQNAGKGQRGNTWESQKGQNLMLSVLLRPRTLPLSHHFILSEVVSLALLKTLQAYNSEFSIKWPNDIYWKDSKIAGILIENDIEGSSIHESIIGIGLNVNQERFLSDAPNPISLCQILNQKTDPHLLLEQFHKYLLCENKKMLQGDFESISQEYQKSLYRLGDYYRFVDKNGEFKAKIQSVAHDGTLSLIDQDGLLRKYLFKEVKYIL